MQIMRIYNDELGNRSFIKLYYNSYADIWGSYNQYKALKVAYSVYSDKPHCILITSKERFMFIEVVTP